MKIVSETQWWSRWVPRGQQRLVSSLFILYFVQIVVCIAPVQSQTLYPPTDYLDLDWLGEGHNKPAPISEKAALLDLWRSTGGSHWHNKWDLRTDPCNDGWYGIFCNEKGHVITINLSQNHLTGFLPHSISRLPFLRELLLNHNLITGIIPKSYSKLTQLEEVNLSHNRITGPLPREWGNLKYIRVLHVAHNEWDDKILPQELYSLQETGQTDVWFNEDLSDPLNLNKKVNGDGYNHPPIQTRPSGQMNAGARL